MAVIVSPPFDENDNANAVLADTMALSFEISPIAILLAPPDIGAGGGASGGTRSAGFMS